MEEAKLVVSIAAVVISLAAIIVSVRTALEVKGRDLAHDRRRLVITSLWDRLIAVRAINKTNANAELVINTLNTLELVALCWTANMVDRDLVFRAFAESYCSRTKEIEGVTIGNGYPSSLIAGMGMDGPALMQGYYTHVKAVCDQLEQMRAQERARRIERS